VSIPMFGRSLSMAIVAADVVVLCIMEPNAGGTILYLSKYYDGINHVLSNVMFLMRLHGKK